MNKNQPFITGFPTHFFGKKCRSLQDAIRDKRRRLQESSIGTYALQFGHILCAETLQKLSTSKRVRNYCNVTVFWAWLAQILETNASCSKAVSLVQAWCDEAGLPKPSGDTGCYCVARGRLNIKFLRAVRVLINSYLNRRITEEDKYRGHVIKSVDGSSVLLDDTDENQQLYPQSSNQQPGCGFPQMAMMGVLNHAHGGWEDFAVAAQQRHDAPIFHKVMHCFEKGDIVCGDRAFCTYEIISTLLDRGADALMRLHPARAKNLDLRRGEKLGTNQRQVVWTKPIQQSKGSTLSSEQWAALPAQITMRLIWFTYRDRSGKQKRMILASTLMDTVNYPWEELAELYMNRWDIELRLRDVKTTMQMEHFRVKTPEMAHKTLEMVIIAYNLVKIVAQEAALASGTPVRLVSFKGALDSIVSYSSRYMGHQTHPQVRLKIWASMIESVSSKTITLRPNRHEPRAVKKRKKSFVYMVRPRATYHDAYLSGKAYKRT